MNWQSLLQKLDIQDPFSPKLAEHLDDQDSLKEFRHCFHLPRVSDVAKTTKHDPNHAEPNIGESSANANVHIQQTRKAEDACVYLCGNSLGLQPKETRQLINEELDVWSKKGVHGHFDHKFNRPWVSIDDDLVVNPSARIVGAEEHEVAILNSLTVNLHLLMLAFYRPTDSRYKIIIEDKAFPSDQYAVQSQLRLHGYTEEALITVKPRLGEYTLQSEDIIKAIEEHGQSVALILFSGVQYYTGQFFDIEAITKTGHKHGAMVGFDLAHAVGNVVLRLHEWGVDFAAWCSYKYLNAGPGGISGLFVHKNNFAKTDKLRLEGWWSNRLETRFKMNSKIDPSCGASGFRMSNPSVLSVISLYASLKVFEQTSMMDLRQKSEFLTGYLHFLLSHATNKDLFQIITPYGILGKIFSQISSAGIVCDKREPDCIRVAPVPLYNSFADVLVFATVLKNILAIC